MTVGHSSIRKKLTRIILITCCAALVVSCATFAVYDVNMSRHTRLQTLTTLAQITGSNLGAAVSFEDPKSATEILSSLRSEKQIIHAALYTSSGAVLATYSRDPSASPFIPPPTSGDQARFQGNRIIVFQGIQVNEHPAGVIYLESDTSAISSREKGLALMLGIALLASLLVALIVGPRLQKPITDPIFELARTAFAISIQKNYSIRAQTASNDEISYLYAQFNQMLEQIQQRDKQLEQIRADLETRVAERTAFLSALVDSIPLGLVATDQQGGVVSVNPAFSSIFGFSRNEVTGKLLDDLIVPAELLMEGLDYTRKRIEGESFRFESKRRRKDGSILDVEIHGVPLLIQGRIAGGFALYQDVTQRHHDEEALRDANTKLNAIIQASPLGIVTTDVAGRIHLCNPAFARLFQFSTQEATGANLNDLIVPEGLRHEAQELTQRGRSGEVSHATTKRKRKDGSLLDVELYGVGLTIGDQLVGGLVLYQDVSRRQRAEEALREANETLSAVFEASPVPIVGLDLDARIVRWNPAAESKFGWTASEVMGRRPPMVPGDRQQMFEKLHAEAIGGKAIMGLEVPVETRGGAILDVSLSRAPLRDSSGEVMGTVDILNDITERKRAEKALRESEERFRLIAETITEVFWISDPSISKMFYISPGYEHVWGRSLESLREDPRSFMESIHPEDRERVISDLLVQRDGKPFDHEYRIIRPDGAIRWVWDRGYPVHDDSGAVTRYVGVAHDITARKSAEESLRKLSQALEQSAESVVITDKNGVIEYVNPCFVESTHFSKEEAVGKNPRILKSGKQPVEFYQKMWASILAGEVFRDTFVNKMKTGEMFYEEKTIAPVKDEHGNITNFVAVGRDITLRRCAEEELKKAKEAAEDANRAKSDFLANMSHEIRTPMNGIIGMTELALETQLTSEQREYLDMVKSSADTLLRVINDILDFSRVEAGKLELESEPFALRASIGETMKLLGHLAHRKNLELAWQTSAEAPEWLVGDCGRLRQMLVNLVGNAIKFTERGEVVVSIGVDGRSKDRVDLHFRISDTGIGIPVDKQELIFGAFTQADGSTTRKYGGTGLGLAITQRLAQLQGGKLWVESEPNKGSVFHFIVRLGLPGRELATPGEPDSDSLRGLRVLVVDDNHTNRQILLQLLAHWRMVPQEAESGKQALELLERAQREGKPFRIAILDFQMPVMDGLSLAHRIQNDARFSATSTIMLSSSAQPGEKSQGRDFGISAYLIKPVEPSELLDAILNAVTPAVNTSPAPVPVSSPEKVLRPASSLRILLAEDNAVNRQLATRLLEKRGHSVVAVNDGRQALQAIEREKFHLVLMDVQMPEMDGLEATRMIRKNEKSTGEHLPVVAVTAHVMKGDREKCIEAGSDDYVSKPIQAEELYSVIDRLQKPPLDSNNGQSMSASPSPAPPFVTEELLDHVQGDRELLADIIRLFRAEVAMLLRELREAAQKADAAAISRTSHTLKGSIGNFGSGPAYQAAKKIDEIARTGDAAAAGALLPHLESEIERLQTALEPYSKAEVK